MQSSLVKHHCNFILNSVNNFFSVEMPSKVISDLLIAMADIEHRLASGTSENIQLCGLLSAFHHAKLNTIALAQPQDG